MARRSVSTEAMNLLITKITKTLMVPSPTLRRSEML